MKDDRMWRGLFLLAALLLVAAVLTLMKEYRPASAPLPGGPTVVVDAGHGGEDGGAVGVDGTVESGVNLAVAQRLEGVLSFCGCDVVMLRREDISLHDPSAATIRQKKVSDIHNRVAMVQETPDPRLISIHQNHFESGKYHGAQVFYANGPLSQPWAALTQQNLRRCLDPENSRQDKPIPANIYLMNHVTCPAILVECGFLSNREESEKLNDPAYQLKLALVIGGSYLQGGATAG